MDDFGYSFQQCEKDWPVFDSVSEECRSIQQPSLVTSEDSDLSDDPEISPSLHKRNRRINISKSHQPPGATDEIAPRGTRRTDKELGEAMFRNRARPTSDDHFPKENKCEHLTHYTHEDVLSASEEELELETVNQFLLARSQMMSSDNSSRNQQCFLISGEKLLSSRSQRCLVISTAESLHSAHLPDSISRTTARQSHDEDAGPATTLDTESCAENELQGNCSKNHIKTAKGDHLDVGFEDTQDSQACRTIPKALPGLRDSNQIQRQHNEARRPAGRTGAQPQSTLGEDLITPTYVTISADSQFAINREPSVRLESMSESLAAEGKCKEDYSITVPEMYEYFYADFGEQGDQNTFFFFRVPSMFKRVKQGNYDPREINLLTTIKSLVRKYLHPTKQGQRAMVSARKLNTSQSTKADGYSHLGSSDNALVKYWGGDGGSQAVVESTIQKGRRGPCWSCTQKDLCLFCFACASWAMKSETSQSDMWKAALLVNVSAISAVRYFRRHVQRENAKLLALQDS